MTIDQLINKWDEILLTVKREYDIQDASFNAWLKPLEPYSIEGNIITLIYPEENEMNITVIKKKYEKLIRITIEDITNESYEINYVFPNNITVKSNNIEETNLPVTNNNYINSNLNPKFTFDTYVVGSTNRYAQTAALAVAETPGDAYNPLFIYGGPGLGKTHLVQAIGNYIIHENPNKNVLYVTCEEWTNEVIDKMRSSNNSQEMSKFREKYRNVDVLIIDDIQFIIGKEQTQEEFFHTFNTLHSANKQIIITCDKHPEDLTQLNERFISRFEMGLLADVGIPDYETRMAIIKNKTEKENFFLNNEVLDYIASNIKSNVREIEGALSKLKLLSRLEKTDITLDIAQQELQNYISPGESKQITPQLIIEVVAEHYGISVDQMISKKRSQDIAKPRQIAMYLCRIMTDDSLEAIGKLLGGRDHTTILHGADKIGNEYETNKDLKNQINAIKKKINPN